MLLLLKFQVFELLLLFKLVLLLPNDAQKVVARLTKLLEVLPSETSVLLNLVRLYVQDEFDRPWYLCGRKPFSVIMRSLYQSFFFLPLINLLQDGVTLQLTNDFIVFLKFVDFKKEILFLGLPLCFVSDKHKLVALLCQRIDLRPEPHYLLVLNRGLSSESNDLIMDLCFFTALDNLAEIALLFHVCKCVRGYRKAVCC